ncbi:phospholipid-binding lipoprotein MlaA [uncultured Gammaproteobacteria bacterium]
MSVKTFALAYGIVVALSGPVLAQTQKPMPDPGQGARATLETPRDLFEPVNRAMFRFNMVVVDYMIEPLGWVLGKVTPGFVRRAGTNVYENISEPEFMFTNLLAGHGKDALTSVGRFLVNSTVGIVGIFDPATSLGLIRRQTEVSEAMCKAGVPPGPYMVLPLIGPTNLFSGGLLGGLLAAEWYALSLVSAALAAGDAIFDISVSVASLRHVGDQPDEAKADPYAVQQREFWDYVKEGCAPTAAKAAPPSPVGASGQPSRASFAPQAVPASG